jgi:hypothetical protein
VWSGAVAVVVADPCTHQVKQPDMLLGRIVIWLHDVAGAVFAVLSSVARMRCETIVFETNYSVLIKV